MFSSLLRKVFKDLHKCSFTSNACFKIVFSAERRNIHSSYPLCRASPIDDLEYDVVLARNVDAKQILNMLRRTFFLDEPLIQSLGLAGRQNTDLEKYCMDCIDEDLSYVALPKSGVAPLSVCLNSTFMAKDIGHLEKLATYCPCKKTQRLLRFWAYLDRESELWNQYGVSRIFEIRILATDQRYRARGLATALVSQSVNLAKELGFPLVRMDCTSHYSSMAAKRLGMEIAYSLKYSDYLTNNGRPIFDTEHPHNSATIFVQNINRPISHP